MTNAPADPYASLPSCDDPTCGCMEPAFTEPMEALEFLRDRFLYAGVGEAVALSYARDIDAILARADSSSGTPVHTITMPEETLSNLIDLLRSKGVGISRFTTPSLDGTTYVPGGSMDLIVDDDQSSTRVTLKYTTEWK